MTGIYLKCEICGNTLGGEEVTPKQQGMSTLSGLEGHKLRELAAKIGWTYIYPDRDYCKKCSQNLHATPGINP